MKFCHVEWRTFASASQSRDCTAQTGTVPLVYRHDNVTVCSCCLGLSTVSSDNTTVTFKVSGKHIKVQLSVYTAWRYFSTHILPRF
jgi:hypothetical protein